MNNNPLKSYHLSKPFCLPFAKPHDAEGGLLRRKGDILLEMLSMREKIG